MKTVWRLSELGKIGEILNDSRTALTQEFLKVHPDWQTNGEFLTTKKAVELILLDKKYNPKYKDHQEAKKNYFIGNKLFPGFANKFWNPDRGYYKNGYEHGENDAWMLEAVKYLDFYINKGEYKKPNKIEVNGIKYADSTFKEASETYPTAKTLVNLWSEYTGSAFYSILDRNNKIPIHTNPGNRDTKTIRIHLPLIIPKNTGWKQLGFESEGTKLIWDEIWAFDNQSLHSAWNYTDERRLAFIIDLDRDFLGLPPAPKRLFKTGSWTNFAIQYTRRALKWHF